MNNVVSLKAHAGARRQRQAEAAESNHDEGHIQHGGGSGDGPQVIEIRIVIHNDENDSCMDAPQPEPHRRGARYAGVWIGALIGLVIGFW